MSPTILEFFIIPRDSKPYLKLKVGMTVTLLKDIDPASGLSNEAKLLITRLLQWSLTVKVAGAGQEVFIARIVFTYSDAKLPFTFNRDNSLYLFDAVQLVVFICFI